MLQSVDLQVPNRAGPVSGQAAIEMQRLSFSQARYEIGSMPRGRRTIVYQFAHETGAEGLMRKFCITVRMRSAIRVKNLRNHFPLPKLLRREIWSENHVLPRELLKNFGKVALFLVNAHLGL